VRDSTADARDAAAKSRDELAAELLKAEEERESAHQLALERNRDLEELREQAGADRARAATERARAATERARLKRELARVEDELRDSSQGSTGGRSE
jgi:hypothetical protein